RPHDPEVRQAIGARGPRTRLTRALASPRLVRAGFYPHPNPLPEGEGEEGAPPSPPSPFGRGTEGEGGK
ncbi:MAG: hypothetical protein OXU61_05085, partial [Gammaproteobacteria bacterium]|nr:hypothetical protein [Gammaproteobacteria bacterium]